MRIKDKEELNLENPIFVHYINVDGMDHKTANEYFDNYSKMINQYSNITNWIIGTNYTKVECVYDGKSKIRNLEISNIIKEINKRVDILSNSSSFEDFKMKVREWRLSEMLNEPEKE